MKIEESNEVVLENLNEELKNKIIFGILQFYPKKSVRDNILKEVLKYKWLDCESFNINIYSNLKLEDQIICAGYQWRMDHWDDFYKTNDSDGLKSFKSIRKSSKLQNE